MSELKLTRTIFTSLLLIALCLVPTASADAGQWSFRVSYEDLPGVTELEAGDLASGIRILEDQAADTDAPNLGMVLATLCGAYVMAGRLDHAEPVCERAVGIGPADTAFNNRGVLQVHRGNLAAARADFDRARPEFIDDYLESLRTADPKLIADSNYGTLERYRASAGVTKTKELARGLRGAAIESLLD